MSKLNILVAGFGFVGQSVATALHRQHNVYIDDPEFPSEVRLPNTDYSYFKNIAIDTQNRPDPDWIRDQIDAVIICVATPEKFADGSCDTSNIADVLEKYGPKRYLIKSTVDPAWLESLDIHAGLITYSPEFLRGSNPNADPTQEFLNQKFAIYGGAECAWWHELMRTALPSIEEVRFMSLRQAAFLKYMENCFFATKVTFFNEMYNIYKQLFSFESAFSTSVAESDVSDMAREHHDRLLHQQFDVIVEAIKLDPRIGESHTQVPGPDGKFGYGGHCLPKDIEAMRNVKSHEGKNAVDTPLLDAVVEVNKRYRNGSN